ncbi:non-ribosomal peptide synthetase [Myxococcus stipitatus DSM 14675]|uniref:Non-ribosomal peptide synthetase n=1 Tax=Myxococcus stipitatus (strain DSM 14675 / JCM 12634 / Mx s8) TaxID=1278073 RepID=L7UEH0_MYXSD|nr:non-ribosomal peptide synthetase [Myxococcus stipitatus]AGC46270.1 non-ribosomal peptide synthetase [Myxococcus stipitatus DSM 14675]
MTQREPSLPNKVERAGRRPPLVHQPHSGVVPQSFAQQRLWFLSQLDAGGTSYNAPFAARLKGPLDVSVLKEAFLAVVTRHEVLRTTFGEEEGRPVQRIHEEAALEWRVEEVGEGDVTRRVEEEARRAFDLERGPLLRVRLLKVGTDDHVLVWVVHHIVFDGGAVGLLEKEVSEEYGAKVKGARRLEVQYADYARWQGEWLQGEVLETQLKWWTQALAEAPGVLELPADRARPAVQTFRGALKWRPLPEGLEGRLRALSRKEGVTLFMTLLAGFQALLARYSGQRDIVVGSPFGGRGHRHLEGLIGFFANMLALRTRVDDVSFQELCGRVKAMCLGAFSRQDVPFEQVVEALHLERDSSRSPLFQVAFVLEGAPSAALVLPGVEVADVPLEPGVSKFDVTLFARESARGLVTYWEFNTDLFDEETVSRWAEAYVRVLEAVVARPELRVSELPLVSEPERARLLGAWNDTRAAYPRDASIHELFEAQAVLTPDAIAVEFEGARLTFAELNRRANQLAHHLRRQGVEPGSRVGLFTRRSLEMVVATLGILKAGGAYVPLDPSYPVERLSFMCEDAGLKVLLVQSSLRSVLPPFGVDVVELEPSGRACSGESEESPAVGVPALALAYVMYTSGSTGRPKGVCIPHRGVVRLVKGSRFVALGPGEVFLQLAPISFDAATLELWGPLLNGGKLVVSSEQAPTVEELEAALVKHGITTLWLTAALFEQVMSTRPEALAAVRQVLTGGDVVSPAAVRARLERGGKVVNGYGPTENTTFTTTQVLEELGQVDAPSLSIGRPIANTQVYVLDASLACVPVGVWGELYTGGDGLAWGYQRGPELTAERFVPHPFSAEPGARLYRTGDRVRYRGDGSLEFAGRLDGQVKLRGFRIELGEVETALRAHPGVREVAVLARDDGPGGRWLVAYVVPSEREGGSVQDLRAHARARLPEYMVPSAFVSLPVLPLTPNGKLDRKVLPSPRAEVSGETSSAPRTAMEQVVADVLAPLLGLERMGREDHFFERGGHSLLATRAMSRLRQALGRDLPVRLLFESPTVARLAERLGREPGPHSTWVALRSGGTKRPFFCIHPVGGTVLAYAELAHGQEHDQPFFGLQAPGVDGEARPLDTVEALAVHHLQTIRTVQPQGPYLLGGWSMGGVLAFEVARRLREQGDDVALLFLIDAYARPETVDAEELRPERLGARFFKDLLRAAGADLPCSEDTLARMSAAEALHALETAGRAAAALPEASLSALRNVFESNLEAAWRHVPRPCAGEVLSLESSESPRPHEWELLAGGGVETHALPGDHYALLRPPVVQQVATILREALARIHTRGRPRRESA